MSRSRFSSLFAKSALAAQASATTTSLLCSVIGKSSLFDDAETGSDMSTSLPWIDDLHNTISIMYLGRGACCPGLRNSAVHIHQDATIENQIVCYSGVSEIERALRTRSTLSQENNAAMLEFVYVKASDDSIADGGSKQNNHELRSPPTIQVVYRLQKTYGSFFTMNTMIKVTVQCQSNQCRKIVFQLPDRAKTGVLATSGLTKNVVGGFNLGNLGKYALARDVWQRMFSKRIGEQSHSTSLDSISDPTFIAEIVRIEECWNEVELIQPFHLSRRINGIFLSSLTYLLCFVI
jgi:hypothetical protein